jgi:4-hydroxyphenylpyruvate dioxygenase
MMPHSIATVSLSGSLEQKLRAIAAAGFDKAEIFENDFLTFNENAAKVRQLCSELGITIVCYQPFRDFEGLPAPQRASAFRRAEYKFDLMQELGTDLMLVCSSVHPDAMGGIGRAADDLRELGERASKRGLRIGYEALAWGRYVSDYRDAWEIVRRAAHPSLGLILDSFHLFAKGAPLDPIRSIPGDKIFLVQLADAPNLHLDALSWSRHFRCFPGQGELPVAAFCEAVAATGYEGPLSLEIFNDQFRAGGTGRIAVDGKRSLILLDDRLARAGFDKRENSKGLPAKTSCLKVEFIEFALDEESAGAVRKLFAAMGFALAGRHISKSVERWSQSGINLVINTERKGFAYAHQITHGPGVCAIGLQVPDVANAIARAHELKAELFHQAVGPGEMDIPAIRGVGGSLIYFIEPKGALSEVWTREFRAQPGATGSNHLAEVDHIAQSMPYNEMLSWLLFYEASFDFARTVEVDIADPGGLVRSQALVASGGSCRITLNGSLAPQTLSNRFLHEFFGAGVQHIAFETTDLLTAVEAMRERGLTFLDIPDNYYDDLKSKYDLDTELLERLRRNRILYDRDGAGEFLQIYTGTIAGRFFFEIVERRAGYGGFGAANAPVRLAAQALEAKAAHLP